MLSYFRFREWTAAFLLVVAGSPVGATPTGHWTESELEGLRVQLYVPATLPKVPASAPKRALMLSLHGCVQKAAALKQGATWETVADRHGMVVALPSARDRSFWGCWDFAGPHHTRTSRDAGYLLKLTEALIARADLNLDRRQVYLTGLSSGGGQSLVMGCLAPEIFAGVGAVAGPSVGFSESDKDSFKAESVAATCRRLAGPHQSALSTQLTSVIVGTDDRIVPADLTVLNALAAAIVYNVQPSGKKQTLVGDGTEYLWTDAQGPRISLISVKGMGHAWPASGGPGASFVTKSHLNYSEYVTEFFFRHNRRLAPPVD